MAVALVITVVFLFAVIFVLQLKHSEEWDDNDGDTFHKRDYPRFLGMFDARNFKIISGFFMVFMFVPMIVCLALDISPIVKFYGLVACMILFIRTRYFITNNVSRLIAWLVKDLPYALRLERALKKEVPVTALNLAPAQIELLLHHDCLDSKNYENCFRHTFMEMLFKKIIFIEKEWRAVHRRDNAQRYYLHVVAGAAFVKGQAGGLYQRPFREPLEYYEGYYELLRGYVDRVLGYASGEKYYTTHFVGKSLLKYGLFSPKAWLMGRFELTEKGKAVKHQLQEAVQQAEEALNDTLDIYKLNTLTSESPMQTLYLVNRKPAYQQKLKSFFDSPEIKSYKAVNWGKSLPGTEETQKLEDFVLSEA